MKTRAKQEFPGNQPALDTKVPVGHRRRAAVGVNLFCPFIQNTEGLGRARAADRLDERTLPQLLLAKTKRERRLWRCFCPFRCCGAALPGLALPKSKLAGRPSDKLQQSVLGVALPVRSGIRRALHRSGAFFPRRERKARCTALINATVRLPFSASCYQARLPRLTSTSCEK